MNFAKPMLASPLDCGAASETGRVCEMQRDHGGEMHCGGDPLKWWTRDGKMVDFRCERPDGHMGPCAREQTQ